MTTALDLQSPQRLCIALQIEHAEVHALIDQLGLQVATDDLQLRRLKKKKLRLRDHIAHLQQLLTPKEPA
jgi:hypothetical protein